jgi:V/A-type H+/Na+-transporting ATPase subunit K
MSAFSVVMFLIPPVAIFFAIYNALRCYKKGAAPTKAMKIHFATLVAVTALCITGAMTALADTGDAAAAVTSNGDGLKYLAAGLCTGIAAIGGGIALGAGIPAAIGATTEDPKAFGKSLIFVALGETLALYGVIISFMIINA